MKDIKLIGQSGTVLLLLLFTALLTAQDNKIELSNLAGEKITMVGFALNSGKEIQIDAVGAGFDEEIKRPKHNYVDPHNMFAYAWILDARTREIVWRMTINNTEGDWWNKLNRTFKGQVWLDEGEYELYFSSLRPPYSHRGGFFHFRNLMDKVFGDEKWWEENSDKWKIHVNGVDAVKEESEVQKYHQALKKSAIVNLTEVRDSENIRAGFTLKKDVVLKIYAIGEGFDEEMHDFAFIIDADSRKRYWQMREDDTEYAGGAIKNRRITKEIEFDAGDYIACFKSDDSHSYNDWNSNPPYDPDFWGLTIYGSGRDFDRSVVETYEEKKGTLIIRLDKLGDYEDVSEGFTLLKPMKLRIYAIGEGRNGSMDDFGWIKDAKSGRMVWEMEYSDTEDAGGTSKNRLFDGVVNFEPGSYIAHFITDDSHSYTDWNRPEPYDPQGWGMKIYALGKEDEENYIRSYDPERDKNIIVQLVRVRVDERVRKSFVLKKPTTLRIYAIGEGDWDEMYDYGWIEDYNTGRIVWEMKYKDTRKAGGAEKNRVFDNTLRLDAGSYIAHFITDDSHAYGDWNTDPPRDKSNWGITIYRYNDD